MVPIASYATMAYQIASQQERSWPLADAMHGNKILNHGVT